ncbi:hypothetical protein FGIG_11832 [Fasciola gigantica]|uniref:Uncharacterized protein n=1 Tax=Fasciola gigantica TaxID=46835 RepID=A0A504YFG2_FASGI|nr:hypothetical protein FGIG_11832 [Fasciola gigantica]
MIALCCLLGHNTSNETCLSTCSFCFLLPTLPSSPFIPLLCKHFGT